MDTSDFYERVYLDLYLELKRMARYYGVTLTTYAKFMAIEAFSPPFKQPWN